MEKTINFLNKYWFFVILLLSIPTIWALLVPGFYGASDDLHIAWLYEFHKALFTGQIPPRFVPDLSFGFGYPLFNFVFPLPFYVGEIFHLLGLSLTDSIKALFLISMPLSGIFMYLLIRQFTSSHLSLIGAILYMYTPYRAVDLYIRGAIGEIVSFVFLPLIVLSLVKIYQSKSLKWVGIGGLSLASLVLSHNITAYMFLSCVGWLIMLQLFFIPKKWLYMVQIFLMIFLGLLISMYFWLPALTESSLVKYDTVFNFVDHFPTFSQLITPYWGYGASVPGPGDGMSFFLGGAGILILMLSIILFFLKQQKIDQQKKVVISWSVSVIFMAFFLMNYRSIFVWNTLPLLPYFQFPWRFLILTTFFIPLLLIVFEVIKFNKYLLIFFLGMIILPVLTYFRPQDFLGREDEYFLNRYIPFPLASDEYKKIQEEYLRLPKNTQKRPDQNYPVLYSGSGKVLQINKINDLHVVASVESEGGMMINFSKYFYPGWTAKLDGQKVQIQSGSPFGQITLIIPQGLHTVEFIFEETGFKRVLDAISLISFLVSLGLINNLWVLLRKTGHSF